jgi:N-methylhydantoinase A
MGEENPNLDRIADQPTPSSSEQNGSVRIGVDIGGTFTDFVVFQPDKGEFETFKLLSTPANPADAVITGLQRILEAHQLNGISPNFLNIVHGSTVATNALLERKGTPTSLVTTKGFADVLQIGRQNRPELYDLATHQTQALVPPERCYEVEERVVADGHVLVPLNREQVSRLVETILETEVKSVAVCLLFSFLHPEHEQEVVRQLRSAGLFVSASCEIIPEYREYERTSTTVVNAYVSPVLDHYLSHLENGLQHLHRLSGSAAPIPGKNFNLRVMQSNGGVISVSEARRFGVRCILSGPAGGVVGSRYTGGADSKLITFDMGGTSTDVSLVDGDVQLTTEMEVGSAPIRIPVLDIHTIGAGGGSIAAIDAGGALRVGPQSAGADPGPACYGRLPMKAGVPTVTDANLVLRRLDEDFFLGGEMKLDLPRARSAINRLGAKIGLDETTTALGIIAIANTHMEHALRLISVERGHDPGDFTLLSFGGAGGLHAADLARHLGMPRLMIPPTASTLSALGMLAANVIKDYTQTVMLPGDSSQAELLSFLQPMQQHGFQEISTEGIPPDAIQVSSMLDMRYAGQSYELTIPWIEPFEDLLNLFHAAHLKIYGYERRDTAIEIVNVRVRAAGKVIPPPLPDYPPGDGDPDQAWVKNRTVFLNQEAQSLPCFRGEALQPGDQLGGPAIILRSDTTILLGPGDVAQVDPHLNLIVAVHPEG